MPEATIASFVLRFTQEHTPETDPVHTAWRGVIRHVQTNEETRFTQIEGALTFIARYVDLTSCSAIEGEGDLDWKPISTKSQNSVQVRDANESKRRH